MTKIAKFLFCRVIFMFFLPLTGCIFFAEEYTPTSYYDIGRLPEKSCSIAKISVIRTLGPYKTNMVFRKKNNQLFVDNYSKWMQSPEGLLRSYLLAALGGIEDNMNAPLPNLSTDILTFEADCAGDKNYAVLSLKYDIEFDKQGGKSGGVLTFRSEMKDSSPTAFAEAMTINVSNFVQCIKEKIEKNNEERENK